MPYAELSKEEQDKDLAQLIPAVEKVKAYLTGVLDIDSIIEQYGLDTGAKKCKRFDLSNLFCYYIN